MFKTLRSLLFDSLPRRLLLGGLTLFVFTLALASVVQFTQFEQFLDERSQARATALAQNLAATSHSWILSHDLAGLQEMAEAMHEFPEIYYAMLIAPDGQVLAHSQPGLAGRYLSDDTSLALLRGAAKVQLLPSGSDMLDAAAPILVNNQVVGWARVGLGQHDFSNFRNRMMFKISALLLVSSIIGGLALWWLGGNLMLGVNRLMQGVRRLEAGERGTNLVSTRGHDELARLAQAFNDMSSGLDLREQALRDSEARWQFALEGSDLGVWDWNAATNKVYFSPRWKTMLGYAESEIGDGFEEWESRLHPDDRARCFADLERHFKGDTPTYVNEHRMRAKDGSWRWILARGQVIERTPDGKPARVIGTHFDMTERRAAEAERAQLQQQLQHAQKMEAIGQLTGGIAHDFNNILGAILGYTTLTLDRFRAELPAKAIGYLEEVEKAGERARDLIQKMLAFARGGGSEVHVLDPRPLIREVIKMLASTLPSSLELHEQIARDVPAIRIDPVQLHQIVTNLVINARDATSGEGKIEVGLRTCVLSGELCDLTHQPIHGEFVELYVRDNGSGIAPDVLPKIFNPFFTTKEVGKGSGMGLAMVMGILREHDAHVRVEAGAGAEANTEKNGTTFHLYFHPANSAASAAAMPLIAPAISESGRHHILIVDDEAPLAHLMGEVLDANGYRVTVLTQPHGALDAFHANPGSFDAVITDQTMPGMTGLELAHAMRQIAPDLAIIMLSGYSDKVDADSAAQHGIQRFFYKPVKSDEVLAALRTLLPAQKS